MAQSPATSRKTSPRNENQKLENQKQKPNQKRKPETKG